MDQKNQPTAATHRAPETPSGDPAEIFDILAPAVQTLPIVFTSPHSGDRYPDTFVAGSRLDPVRLRRSEDAFVDQLYAAAPQLGAPLLRALFPRAYVDPNREKFELDPAMFDGPLPDHVNAGSARVGAGLGTVAKVVTSGDLIYDAPLDFAEVCKRIETHYVPYHEALQGLIAQTRDKFGYCVVIDCHSMPSVGGPMDRDPGHARVEFVLGDNHGASCNGIITDRVDEYLRAQGRVVRRNLPYAGGYTTVHYGRPDAGIHALQIEVNRAIYMDEETLEKSAGFGKLERLLSGLIGELAALPDLRPGKNFGPGETGAQKVVSPTVVRSCEPADLAAVRDIYADFVENSSSTFDEESPDVAGMRTRWEERKEKNLPFIVAVDDDQVVGYAYASTYRNRTGYRYFVENSIYVSPRAVGRGVGRALLGTLIERCTENGYRQMIAVIGGQENAASIGLHSAFGFEIVGRLPGAGHKFGQWLDLVLMQRSLGEGNKTPPQF